MKHTIKILIALLLANLLLAACSSAPEPKHNPYNDADSQRAHADKAQRELSSDTMKQ